jgi:DUF917 family protein
MKTLLYDDIVDIIWGAGLLAGGGGGPVKFGLQMLQDYINEHKIDPADIKLPLFDPGEILTKPFVYAAVTAGMGAPSKITGDFTPWANNAFDAIKVFASKMDPPRDIQFTYPVELGGFNTFIAMLIALENPKIQLLDVDASARAVPGLDTVLSAVNGNATTPTALADDKNNKVIIDLIDPSDAQLAEDLAREITVQLGEMAGVSGWLIGPAVIQSSLGVGSLTLSQQIGNILRNPKITDKFLEIQNYANCRELYSGQLTGGASALVDGFDVGCTKGIQGTTTYRADFANESLVISRLDNGNPVPIMTAPDIIACYNTGSTYDYGMPLTNSDLFNPDGTLIKGLEVSYGLISVNSKWWVQPITDLQAVWDKYFSKVGYQGKIIQYT